MNFSLFFATVLLTAFAASKPTTTTTEKPDGQKKVKDEFEQPDGVVPEFTGSFVTENPETASASTQTSDEDTDEDYFGESTGGAAVAGPITNPAATYLEGSDFEKVTQPSCQMLGCTGPIPNDGSYSALSATLDNKACNQIFVAMNGCTDNKGYPMGMLCSVCCDCANSFVQEMKKTFGYKSNIPTSTFN
ncbi:uncharacterized protein CELE_F45D3.4 [Caenorhabditis elegans]|uniref:Uncharacterized protein n=1 Tax=Caenorhabditis elegans TaxID=6239 RepID=Q52GY5_CAEEL|nr:Uncharacterized protein CELE_F45D3.4 [Caenorhabditis elegans]CAI91164.1 Uncharacterized protein CELE_F45D3.4 [Caenorhabditis elegans]|eukprot:NP_001023931.1 Uncharacterized protein CELE_F45D3.4 [Caenorhabditis elegans]